MQKMVISHDIADTTAQDAEEVFRWLHEFNDNYCFAINIKADGLKGMLKFFIEKYHISNYFLFDMSIPQMVEFHEMGLKYFTRQSEIEKVPYMYDEAAGVWVDGFWSTTWITEDLLNRHIQSGKTICLVSPELHGKKNYKHFWSKVKSYSIDFNKVILCTDHPDEAKECFYE